MNIQTRIAASDSATTGAAPMQEALANFVTELRHDTVPATVRKRALHHMLDAAGIAMASTRYDFAHKTLAGIKAISGEGQVPVLGMPAKLPLRRA